MPETLYDVVAVNISSNQVRLMAENSQMGRQGQMKKAHLLSYGVMVGIAVTAMPHRILAGLCAGLIAVGYESHRRRRFERQQRAIADVNHEVRNALQILNYLAYAEDPMELINGSVKRVESALRHVAELKDVA